MSLVNPVPFFSTGKPFTRMRAGTQPGIRIRTASYLQVRQPFKTVRLHMTVPGNMKEEIMSNCNFPGLSLLHSPWVKLELGLLGQGSRIPLIRLRVYKHTRDQLHALYGGTRVYLALAALKYSTTDIFNKSGSDHSCVSTCCLLSQFKAFF